MGPSIKEFLHKIKAAGNGVLLGPELFPALLLVAVGVGSFGLGRLSVVLPAEPTAVASPIVELTAAVAPAVPPESAEALPLAEGAAPPAVSATPGAVVGSKNSDKYHLPWCSGAKRISEANKVWFASVEEARAAGYVPASNCPGL